MLDLKLREKSTSSASKRCTYVPLLEAGVFPVCTLDAKGVER